MLMLTRHVRVPLRELPSGVLATKQETILMWHFGPPRSVSTALLRMAVSHTSVLGAPHCSFKSPDWWLYATVYLSTTEPILHSQSLAIHQSPSCRSGRWDPRHRILHNAHTPPPFPVANYPSNSVNFWTELLKIAPYNHMCKRTFRQTCQPERARENKAYTQGPLDEVFGQHPAFPVEGGDDTPEVAYLRAVRAQAESDSHVHFVSREQHVSVNKPPAGPVLDVEYVRDVVENLLKEKASFQSEFEADLQVADIEVDPENIIGIEMDENRKTFSEDAEDAEIQSSELHTDASAATTEQTGASSSGPVHGVPFPETAAKWRQLVFSQPPPQHLNDLDHPTAIKLVILLTRWLLVSMPATLTQWLHAVFVRIDNALDHTEAAIIRDLGRKARLLRDKFRAGVEEGVVVPEQAVETVEYVVAVVGGYFGQRDLLGGELPQTE